MRLDKPVGFILLFIPCAYGIVIGAQNLVVMLQYLLLFFIGSVLMRSCGCIINDYFDIDFDKHVARTKNRPLTTGEISKKEAYFLVLILLSASCYILTYLPNISIIISVTSIIPIIIYPLMKRITYYAQFFLGITFNLGLIIGFTTVHQNFTSLILIPYFGFVCWTIYYDTIYALQDIKDDYRLNIKSFAMYLEKNNCLNIINIFWLLFIICYLLGNILILDYSIYYVYILLPMAFMFYTSRNISRPQKAVYNPGLVFQHQIYVGLMLIIILFVSRINQYNILS